MRVEAAGVLQQLRDASHVQADEQKLLGQASAAAQEAALQGPVLPS